MFITENGYYYYDQPICYKYILLLPLNSVFALIIYAYSLTWRDFSTSPILSKSSYKIKAVFYKHVIYKIFDKILFLFLESTLLACLVLVPRTVTWCANTLQLGHIYIDTLISTGFNVQKQHDLLEFGVFIRICLDLLLSVPVLHTLSWPRSFSPWPNPMAQLITKVRRMKCFA